VTCAAPVVSEAALGLGPLVGRTVREHEALVGDEFGLDRRRARRLSAVLPTCPSGRGTPAPYRDGENRRQRANPSCRSGLPQAEVAENEEHYHHNANNVENAVHVASSFLARDRITVAPDPIALPRDRPRERSARAGCALLPSLPLL
jgi:hypothetical protein